MSDQQSEVKRLIKKQLEEAEIMAGFINSAGWLLLKEFMIDRIRQVKVRVFEKHFPISDLEASKREVYILKKILDRPERLIALGKEAEAQLKS